MTKKRRKQSAAKAASAKGSAKRPKALVKTASDIKMVKSDIPKPLLGWIALKNTLSFRDMEIELCPLNVLIGPNASGKSNFIEALALLSACPSGLHPFARRSGPLQEWVWKGLSEEVMMEYEVVVSPPNRPSPLRHRFLLRTGQLGQIFEDERIELAEARPGQDRPVYFFSYEYGTPKLYAMIDGKRKNIPTEVDQTVSILFQRKDRTLYPELTELGELYGKIGIYRGWTFGKGSSARKPVATDLPNDVLMPNAENLALVLNRLKLTSAGERLLQILKELYQEVEAIETKVEGNTVQLFLREKGGYYVPATRLSDGTFRFLGLLAILLNPSSPPLVCIEEPELGLHPDVQVTLAKLLVEASERMQLIVTTHSEVIVDALTETPEHVVVCDKVDGETKMKRLNAKELKGWLKDYRLGDLWMRGYIGGTRW